MNSDLLLALLGGLANAFLVLLLAPAFEGVLRKVTARIQSRQGPPLCQPYYDLLKLLGKEDLESGESPGMQRFAVYLSLATTLTIAGLLPLGYGAPLNGVGDVLLLVYLLTLSSVCTLLAGLAAGSTFSLLGMSREMMTVITLEPLLVVALLVSSLRTQSLRIDTVLAGGVYASTYFPFSGLILFVLLLLAFQAFLQRAPFDIAEAETELMDGPMVEYSGPKLALFKHARMAKLVLYSALFVNLFLPWGATLPFPLGWLVFWGKVGLLVLLATVIAATHARYRIDQAIRFFGAWLGIALLALLLAAFGY